MMKIRKTKILFIILMYLAIECQNDIYIGPTKPYDLNKDEIKELIKVILIANQRLIKKNFI